MDTPDGMIGPGERAPDFALPRGEGHATRFYGLVGGHPAVLLLSGGAGAGELAGLVDSIGGAVPEGDLHVVAREALPAERDAFLDPDDGVHEAYGVPTDGPPTALVLDRNVRVLSVARGRDGAVAAVAEQLPGTQGGRPDRGAPVLLIPDALDAQLCTRLIERWREAGARRTGVEATGRDGHRGEELDEHRKRRRDHTVEDEELLQTLTAHIGRRIMPEIRKAFAYRATRFEGFKIGCYTADDAGFFEPHRDNLSRETSHRRFALTLNLNEDYEGGELRFPEYGPRRYRPDAGEALVFSGSHLHEVLPVTAGRRFVLLSFLFGSGGRRSG